MGVKQVGHEYTATVAFPKPKMWVLNMSMNMEKKNLKIKKKLCLQLSQCIPSSQKTIFTNFIHTKQISGVRLDSFSCQSFCPIHTNKTGL